MFKLFTKLVGNSQEEHKSYNSSLSKSVNPQTSASLFIGGDGSLLKTLYYTAYDEISRNISVNTIISKQSSIVNEATLVVKEKDDKTNESTSQPDFLNFLSWIENPNSYPFPRSRAEIFKYILKNSYKKGIFGIVYVFDKKRNFKHIKIPVSIQLENFIYDQTKYRVEFNNKTFTFPFDVKYRNFSIESSDEIMILQVGGNFDNDLQNYSPIFNEALAYILLQNYLIDFASSFHQNSCFPSQIITLNYITEKDSGGMDPKQMKEFDDAVKAIEAQMNASRGSRATGGIIIPKNPNIKVDIKPLAIPTNATDNIAYQGFVSQKIYALVDGGSVDAFEGKSEYSNNASSKLQDLYDGSFRLFNSLVIDPMNQFMQGLVGSFNGSVNPKNYFLEFDVSNVRIYQKQFIAQDVMLVQNNVLKINEARRITAKTSSRYSFLEDSKNGDVFNSELSGNATKPKADSSGKSAPVA